MDLIELLAHIEVTIDYPEHDVEDVTVKHICEKGSQVAKHIESLRDGSRVGRLLSDGIRTVIVGKPNVGKSSLLNVLLGFERAIVTNVPGTTRDIIAERVNVCGVPLHISDTAGIRDTDDQVEKIGVEKSRKALLDAELILYVVDATSSWDERETSWFEGIASDRVIVLINKIDLIRTIVAEAQIRHKFSDSRIITISAITGEGLDTFASAIEQMFLMGAIRQQDLTYAGSERQIALLAKAALELRSGIESARSGVTLDLVSVDFHATWITLGEVIGESVGEDLLDQIFSQFCLGK